MQLSNTGYNASVEQLKDLCDWLKQESDKTEQRSQVEWPELLRAMQERAMFLEYFTIPGVERLQGNQLPLHKRETPAPSPFSNRDILHGTRLAREDNDAQGN